MCTMKFDIVTVAIPFTNIEVTFLCYAYCRFYSIPACYAIILYMLCTRVSCQLHEHMKSCSKVDFGQVNVELEVAHTITRESVNTSKIRSHTRLMARFPHCYAGLYCLHCVGVHITQLVAALESRSLSGSAFLRSL